MNSATITAFAAPMAGAFGFAVRHFFARRDKREQTIVQREREWMEAVESRLAKVERAYIVVVGVMHVIVDDLEPGHSSLGTMRGLLKDAFPVTAEMPADLLNLLARLDAKERRSSRK